MYQNVPNITAFQCEFRLKKLFFHKMYKIEGKNSFNYMAQSLLWVYYVLACIFYHWNRILVNIFIYLKKKKALSSCLHFLFHKSMLRANKTMAKSTICATKGKMLSSSLTIVSSDSGWIDLANLLIV